MKKRNTAVRIALIVIASVVGVITLAAISIKIAAGSGRIFFNYHYLGSNGDESGHSVFELVGRKPLSDGISFGPDAWVYFTDSAIGVYLTETGDPQEPAPGGAPARSARSTTPHLSMPCESTFVPFSES